MQANVYFTDLNTTPRLNLFKKLGRLIQALDMRDVIEKDDIAAIKLHFGEKGNHSYVSPQFLRIIADKINIMGGKPFLTDTNTLYVGSRGEAVSHLRVAVENGFAFSVVNAPVIIADGLRGRSYNMVQIDKKWYKEVDIASEIYNADSLIGVTHFKCHELAGIGGVIKNIGMGCAGVRGKLNQHSNVRPYVIRDRCTGCRRCIAWCNFEGAIVFSENKAEITEKCVGCGECILPCPEEIIKIKWDAASSSMQEKMAEHFLGALQNKKGKAAYITFVTQVSPACDCYPSNDVPIVNDVGILASKDPVAIDQAAADLVNKQEGNKKSRLSCNFGSGQDKFRGVYPDIDWTVQLSYSEELGLGTRKYKLTTV